jgi:hypothetical protein
MNYKLGKLPAKIDLRTLKLAYILQTTKLPSIPYNYDFDVAHQTTIAQSMFGNDVVGCCVIASRANHTLRFEFDEVQYHIPITTQIVIDEYYKEQGYIGNKCWLAALFQKKPDNGLIMLESLNNWRKVGWNLYGNQYTIYAFAALNRKDHEEVKEAIYLLNGVQTGVTLTQDAMNQFNSNSTWDITPDTKIIGGHAVYVVGYSSTGPICITWAKKQQMTWAWWDKYVDEAYAIVDNKDTWASNSIIDVNVLDQYLHTICGTT